jgi:hypothetical protein
MLSPLLDVAVAGTLGAGTLHTLVTVCAACVVGAVVSLHVLRHILNHGAARATLHPPAGGWFNNTRRILFLAHGIFSVLL